MIIFQVVKINAATIGLFPNQQQKLNGRQKASLILYFLAISSIVAFILFEASTIEEFMHGIFVITSITSIGLNFISVIYKNDEIFKVIKDCEKELTMSKFWLISNKRNELDQTLTISSICFIRYPLSINLGLSNNAESQVMYKDTNRFVENWCDITYAIGRKFLLPTLILPKTILSYFIYFTTDAGNSAFELPFPSR